MAASKRVRIIKKIRQDSGDWRFVSLPRIGNRYVWDTRPGYYFVEWWDGKKRRRELAGQAPSEATEAQRRKRNELLGEMVAGGKPVSRTEESTVTATTIADAKTMFLAHVRVHSPDKPRTLKRYEIVLDHMERILSAKRFAEAISRADIDEYKTARSREKSEQHPDRPIAPRTINYEVSVLRTFFYFLINERGLQMKNPCERFKELKDPRAKAKRKPPTYSKQDLAKIFAKCDEYEKTIFATLLLTGQREEELYFLTWADVNLRDAKNASIRVTGEGKAGFSPKDYEEREIPITEDLANRIAALERSSEWVFPGRKGKRMTHLLRRLKEVATAAKVSHATLHRFRHTYATRLLENGADIVTVQKLMGHSDLDTTRQYLNPDDELKRKAVNRLSGLEFMKAS